MNGVPNETRAALTRRHWRWLFLAGSVVIVVVLFAVYVAASRATAIRRAVARATATTHVEAAVTSALVSRIEADLPTLVGLPVVETFLTDTSDAQIYEQAARAFSSFVSAKQIYDQARVIDGEGYEVLRVNKLGVRAEVVSEEQLQDKGDRYYVQGGFDARSGTWYVSAFDLNVEKGEVELPRKPMIRLAAPVFIDGSAAGLVVLNLLGDVIIESYRDATREEPGTVALANEEGWWLYVDDPAREWGNMFPGTDVGSVQESFGPLWSRIRNEFEVSTVTDDWIVSTRRLAPFTRAAEAADVGSWYIVNHASQRELGVDIVSVVRGSIPLLAVALLLMVGAAWLLANATYDRNRYRDQIERAAYIDEVTGVPNRRYLMDQLERKIDVRNRYGHDFSILFLDLDGFKAVNDTIGHDAGDQVLREVARRLLSSVRKSDTVARLGGDEFVVVLVETPGRAPGEHVAGKILTAIGEPIALNRGEARVGTSIGVVWTGEDNVPPLAVGASERLLHMADEAMYSAKRAGKNRIIWAGT